MTGTLRHASLAEILWWLLRRRQRFRVVGTSMLPGIASGEEVLIDPRAYRRRPPQAGDIVLVRHPYRSGVQMVKRVVEVDDGGQCFVVGDNPTQSTDSRSFGKLPPDHVLGRVTGRFL